MTKTLKIWLWLSFLLTAAGALLLYPIGRVLFNCIFLAVKIGMLTGLLILLFRRKKFGLILWALCSIGAVLMTIVKWNLAGSGSVLLALSMAVDLCMPAVAWVLIGKGAMAPKR
mgnify:CR=1 FL=1